MRFPDFYCIGAEKAGTTWIYENLSMHPQIFSPYIKEIHYFNHLYLEHHRKWTDNHRNERYTKALKFLHEKQKQSSNKDIEEKIIHIENSLKGELTDSWYANFFKQAKREQLCGEYSPSYGLLPSKGIKHITGLNSNAKYFIILRNPVDREISKIKMELQRKYLSILDELPENQLETVIIKMINEEKYNYIEILKNWYEFVDNQNFKVFYFNDIKQQPHLLLKKLCSFLEIEYNEKYFLQAEKKVHKGMDIKIPESIYEVLQEKHKACIRFFHSMFDIQWK